MPLAASQPAFRVIEWRPTERLTGALRSSAGALITRSRNRLLKIRELHQNRSTGRMLGPVAHSFEALSVELHSAEGGPLLRSLFHQHELHLSDVYCLCSNHTGYIFLKNDGFVFY